MVVNNVHTAGFFLGGAILSHNIDSQCVWPPHCIILAFVPLLLFLFKAVMFVQQLFWETLTLISSTSKPRCWNFELLAGFFSSLEFHI